MKTNKKAVVMIAAAIGFAVVAMAANEINLSGGIVASKGYASAYKQPGSLPITWNGNKVFSSVIALTQTPAAMSKGSVGNLGYCYARNNDATNSVALSIAGVTNIVFKPGEYSIFRLAPAFDITSLYANSISNSLLPTNNAGNADFEFTILED